MGGMSRAGGRIAAPGASPPNNLYSLTVRPSKDAFKSMPRAMLSRNKYVPERKNPNVMQDSDGEEMRICPCCHLPVGDFGYTNSSKTALLHGECKAQLMLREAKEDEEARQRSDATLKKKERSKYNIGWKRDMIPQNLGLASKMEGHQISQNMCGLVLENGSVKVVPTNDPAACVNLEYLSLALRVRVQEGREPLFSLDMKGAPSAECTEPEDLWQVKRFEPCWLAGTSVGEVMFQADYHLKELSMGESEQPVVGMLSAFDLSKDSWYESDWRAREWFVVNHAEIRKSEANVLMPYVKMAVEAREQTVGSEGLEDSVITRSDHPLVKYAEAFSEHFDLIAERRSSIYHLRELAKASVLAKYLLDAQVDLDDSWFDLVQEVKQLYRLEIPQLWNQRRFSQVDLQDGKILNAERGMGMGTHGVYGGVGMGLDRIDLGATTMQPGAGEAPYSLLFSAAERGAVMARGVVTPPSLMEPRGVDLNLSKFDLSETVQATEAVPATLSQAFWSNIATEQGSVFKEEDRHLLKDVFNCKLSDRREDGDLFVPPDTRATYMRELRALVDKEAKVRQERKEHFLSEEFIVGSAGPLFPSSWANSFGIAQTSLPVTGVKCTADEQQVDCVKASAPEFDMLTEDGSRYRIYRSNHLEVRTIEDQDGKEVVGALFSSCISEDAAISRGQVTDDAKIVKAIEYVECSEGSHHFYVVLETESGDLIAVEKLASGLVGWVENAKNLEARNALAKVTRSVEQCAGGASVRDVKVAAGSSGTCASASARKQFARRIFQQVSVTQA